MLINKKLGTVFSSLPKVKKRIVIYVRGELNPKKVFQDEEGRVLEVEITDGKRKILIVGIYAPNGAKEKFFCKIKQNLESESYNQIMLLGDFNGIIDPIWDKTPRNKRGKLPKVFFYLTQQEMLEDVWRLHNKGLKDYTYYSACKNSWTRIEMVWASKTSTPVIKKVEILPKILSDHNPVLCVIRKHKMTYKWRLNEDILQTQNNIELIQKEIGIFFQDNWNNGVKNEITWDTFKAYIRGVLLAINSKEKRLKDQKMRSLQSTIKEKELEVCRKKRNKKKAMMELKILQEQMHEQISKEIEKSKILRQKEFDGANKPGRMLAWQLKK